MVPPRGGSNPSTPNRCPSGGMKVSKDFVLFSGSSHPELAKSIAGYLKVPLGNIQIETFPDNEIGIHILENVRGKEVFVLQSIVGQPNLYLMEMFILIDALKRASASSIVAVLPYYGYGRQDRKQQGRVPITAKLVANLLEKAGATRVMTVDLHSDQIQGFFDIPVDHLTGVGILAKAIKKSGLDNLVVVAPDLGSMKYARQYASRLACDFALVDKRRIDAVHVDTGVLIGKVEGKNVLFVDDICSTGATLRLAAKVCKRSGAKKMVAAITHGLRKNLALEEGIEKVFVTDTVPREDSLEKGIEVVSMAELLAKAIMAVTSSTSISALFD